MGGSLPFLATTNDYTPINSLVAPTLSDTVNDPAGISRGIICLTVGTIKIRTGNDEDVSIVMPATSVGTILFVRCKRVWSTGTSGTYLLAY
jgi:hypothetical protein